MNLENDQWNIADEEFSLWLNGNKQEGNLDLTDILKSTFLAFRQKQIHRLSSFCKQAFEYYQEQENLRKQKRLLVQESQFEDNNINFRKCEYSESEKRDQIVNENKKIFKGILSGNQKVFNDLYEDEFPKVVKLVINNSGSVDVAKDVFQDALVILIEMVYTKKLELTCTVSTYLYSICRFLWMDQLRQNKREMPLKDEYSYNNAEITVAGFENTPDIYEHVTIAIETLGEPCKELLECFYYKNLSWAEIASKLGYANAASARNQKYKCLERIKKLVSVEAE